MGSGPGNVRRSLDNLNLVPAKNGVGVIHSLGAPGSSKENTAGNPPVCQKRIGPEPETTLFQQFNHSVHRPSRVNRVRQNPFLSGNGSDCLEIGDSGPSVALADEFASETMTSRDSIRQSTASARAHSAAIAGMATCSSPSDLPVLIPTMATGQSRILQQAGVRAPGSVQTGRRECRLRFPAGSSTCPTGHVGRRRSSPAFDSRAQECTQPGPRAAAAARTTLFDWRKPVAIRVSLYQRESCFRASHRGTLFPGG